MRVDDLNLPTHIYRILLNEGISTVEQLCAMWEAEIERFPGLGKVGRRALINEILRAGFSGPRKCVRGAPVKHRIRIPMGRAVA